MKQIFSFLCLGLIIVTLISCKGSNKKRASTWTINGTETFTAMPGEVNVTTDCNPDNSYCIASLVSNDPSNRFSCGFYLDHFPTSGKWAMGSLAQTEQADPNYFYIDIRYNNKMYIPLTPNQDTVHAGSNKNHATYQFQNIWFINKQDVNDSILVSGTINEP